MEKQKTHWKRLINPDYIGVYALPDGHDLTVTIDFVRRETVVGTGGKKEECTVARLVDQKPLILNVTNSKTIHRLYGPYIDDWAGKQITLYASTTRLAGETVECLRIRPVVEVPKLPAISAERFDKAIESIKAGKYSIDKMRSSFSLTALQDATLDEIEAGNA
jgi:hypothetical protein